MFLKITRQVINYYQAQKYAIIKITAFMYFMYLLIPNQIYIPQENCTRGLTTLVGDSLFYYFPGPRIQDPNFLVLTRSD